VSREDLCCKVEGYRDGFEMGLRGKRALRGRKGGMDERVWERGLGSGRGIGLWWMMWTRLMEEEKPIH
jgi:hypothetical protein